MTASLDRYCFMSVYHAEIDDSVSSNLSKALQFASPYLTKNANSNSNATSFDFAEKNKLVCDLGEFNMVRSIDFSNWHQLECILIGSYSFKNLSSIELIGLPKLKCVEFDYSGFPFFDERTYDEIDHIKKPFRMCDCPSVTHLVLGTETLSSFTSLLIESLINEFDKL